MYYIYRSIRCTITTDLSIHQTAPQGMDDLNMSDDFRMYKTLIPHKSSECTIH